MPEDYCECQRPLVSERNKRLDQCRICEKIEARKRIADTSAFVENQPTLRYEDGLTYVIENEPEFDD